jgi:hypothetical protein
MKGQEKEAPSVERVSANAEQRTKRESAQVRRKLVKGKEASMLKFEGSDFDTVWRLEQLFGEEVGLSDDELIAYIRGGQLRTGIYSIPDKQGLFVGGVRQVDLLNFLDRVQDERGPYQIPIARKAKMYGHE